MVDEGFEGFPLLESEITIHILGSISRSKGNQRRHLAKFG